MKSPVPPFRILAVVATECVFPSKVVVTREWESEEGVLLQSSPFCLFDWGLLDLQFSAWLFEGVWWLTGHTTVIVVRLSTFCVGNTAGTRIAASCDPPLLFLYLHSSRQLPGNSFFFRFSIAQNVSRFLLIGLAASGGRERVCVWEREGVSEIEGWTEPWK